MYSGGLYVLLSVRQYLFSVKELFYRSELRVGVSCIWTFTGTVQRKFELTEEDEYNDFKVFPRWLVFYLNLIKYLRSGWQTCNFSSLFVVYRFKFQKKLFGVQPFVTLTMV